MRIEAQRLAEDCHGVTCTCSYVEGHDPACPQVAEIAAMIERERAAEADLWLGAFLEEVERRAGATREEMVAVAVHGWCKIPAPEAADKMATWFRSILGAEGER